jgi:hypothetical protein
VKHDPISVFTALTLKEDISNASSRKLIEQLLPNPSYIFKYLHLEAQSIVVYWQYSSPLMVPCTYLMSISTTSPRSKETFTYFHFIFFVRYFLTNPSDFKILPIVLSFTFIPSFSSLQLSLFAQSLVSFLSSITLSLIRIEVSLGQVLGRVGLGTNPSSP